MTLSFAPERIETWPLAKLAPYGQANGEPVFVTRNLQVAERRLLGNGDHLQLRLKEKNVTWMAMGFGMGKRIGEVTDTIDLAYTVGIDRYTGLGALQLRIRDWRPAKQA